MNRPDTAERTVASSRPVRHFHKYRSPLSLDHARRQGDISQLAYLVMGGRDPAIAFLNGENVVLGGRPLAIATASPEGYVQVAEIIRSGASVPEST
ncbi:MULTISPECIES: hypothetical protein [Sphingopyxis]|jgi:hypothetical protein|uniref:Antitoxin Xre/MbcA/ParS-like toxin-binding domain-containing protein n=2 Tax=Sphingopyxis TaxID=165697 RepID=A0A7W9B4V4_9SPHN|nr:MULTISPECIES: hypothetical protein [Sphingopyxis]AMG74883.1 Uncharacterized protein SGRAN_2523 [Sphingopyxis granuli]MBB5706329.1 hypothetical protein [Sphingopyxis panaciterrulae]MCW0197162.1 hypothetical protein [Sphingopyxis sp.]PAL20671.1 hypothetical protein CD928_16205 [Sphingopyxis sp. GW247-27LB]HEX2811911.1 hypothetical protein [Sphingopyxis sp.]